MADHQSMPQADHAVSHMSIDAGWRRVMWVLLLAVLFVKGKLLYVLFYTVALTYFVSRRLLFRAFRAVRCVRTVESERMFYGESTTVTVHVENTSRIPLVWLLAHDELTHNLSAITPRRAVFSVGPGQRQSFTYEVRGRRRGIHALGPIQLEAGDALGLGHVYGRASVQSKLIVYPRIHPMNALALPSSLPYGDTKTRTRFFADPARSVGPRPYRPGDPYKNMHWKATAKRQELYVREFEPTVTVDAFVMLNLNEYEYDVSLREHFSELAVETAASLAYALTEQRQNVGFATNGLAPADDNSELKPGAGSGKAHVSSGVYIPPRKGSSNLTRVLDVLATVQCGPAQSFPAFVNRRAGQFNSGTTVILVTPDMSPDLMNVAITMRRRGFNMIVVAVGSASAQADDVAVTGDIPVFYVQAPSDLQTFRPVA